MWFEITLFGLNLFLNFYLCYQTRSIANRSINYKVESKIVGGKAVSITKFPSSVMVFNYGALCGGSILNSWAVLSAAHCFDHNKDTDDIAVHTGSKYTYDNNAKIYKVSHLVAHAEYNKTMPFACDIAVVFVATKIKFGKRAQKGILVNSDYWMSEKEKKFLATGWGWTEYGGPISKVGLMMTPLRYVDPIKCGKMHRLKLTPDMFCLYGDAARDTCKGDSGGGVSWNRMLVGIVSHGDGCARRNKPSVYSNIWYFRDWIENTIKTYFTNNCCSGKDRKENKTNLIK